MQRGDAIEVQVEQGSQTSAGGAQQTSGGGGGRARRCARHLGSSGGPGRPSCPKPFGGGARCSLPP
eukprot:2042031-Prymnesium_polylepis.1